MMVIERKKLKRSEVIPQPSKHDQDHLIADPLCVLPAETFHHILSFLPVRTLSQLALVSTVWRRALASWVHLKSTACLLAPSRRQISQDSNEALDEYGELGLLCRRLISDGSLSERAHYCVKFIRKVQKSEKVCCRRFEQVALAMFCRAAVPLHLCSEKETCEAMWRVLKDTSGLDREVLEVAQDKVSVIEASLQLRTALRLMFLSPSPRDIPSLSMHGAGRARLLRALAWGLPLVQQARLLYICYGPRGAGGVCCCGTYDMDTVEAALLLNAGPRAAAAILAVLFSDGFPSIAEELLGNLAALSHLIAARASISIGAVVRNVIDLLPDGSLPSSFCLAVILKPLHLHDLDLSLALLKDLEPLTTRSTWILCKIQLLWAKFCIKVTSMRMRVWRVMGDRKNILF